MNVPQAGLSEATIVARERLRFLAIGFYVRGGVVALFSCFLLIYFAMFFAISFIPESGWNPPAKASHSSSWDASPTPAPVNPGPPPAIVFRIFAGIMGGMTLLGWTLGALTAYAGRCIQKRKHRVFVYVMAAFNCIFIPYGTLLGVCTFIILGGPAAIAEFAPREAPAPAG